MSHQGGSAPLRGPVRGVRGARLLAALGIATLTAGLVLAIAQPAAAASCTGDCSESSDDSTTSTSEESDDSDDAPSTVTTSPTGLPTTTLISDDESSDETVMITSTLPPPTVVTLTKEWVGVPDGSEDSATIWLAPWSDGKSSELDSDAPDSASTTLEIPSSDHGFSVREDETLPGSVYTQDLVCTGLPDGWVVNEPIPGDGGMTWDVSELSPDEFRSPANGAFVRDVGALDGTPINCTLTNTYDPENRVTASVQWSGQNVGSSQVWITPPEGSDVPPSDIVPVEAGVDGQFASLLVGEWRGDLDGVQIHQILSDPGAYPTISVTVSPPLVDGVGFTITGPDCSDPEQGCVWTLHYFQPSSLRSSAAAFQRIALPLPPRGAGVTITNVGVTRGGGSTPATTTATTATSSTPTTTPTTSAPEVLGESSSMTPVLIAAPETTVVAPALASTGVAADRYTTLALLLIVLGSVMLIFASGRLHRGERR